MWSLKSHVPHEVLQHLEVDLLKLHCSKAFHLKTLLTFCGFHISPKDYVYYFPSPHNVYVLVHVRERGSNMNNMKTKV